MHKKISVTSKMFYFMVPPVLVVGQKRPKVAPDRNPGRSGSAGNRSTDDILRFLPFLMFSFSKFLSKDDESSWGCFFRMSIRTLSDDIDPRRLRCIFIIDFEKESRLENLYRIFYRTF